MKSLLMVLTLLISYGRAYAQQVTEVKGHKMGESITQFISESNIPNLLVQCHQLPMASQNELARERDDNGYDSPHKQTKEEQQQKKAAARLDLDLQLCASALLAERGFRASLVLDMPNQSGGTGTFQDGNLALVEMEFDGLAELLPSLEEKYGKPTTTFSEPLQNAYGATFDAGRAGWQMPDGTQIMAIEDIKFGISGGYYRVTKVSFESKEERKRREPNKQQQQNPFDH